MIKRQKKKTCLLFGEGRKEETFFSFLEKTEKFKSKFFYWSILTDHASGESPEIILQKCITVSSQIEYNLILCFIDYDKLIHDYPRNHDKKKKELDDLAESKNIKIIWQHNNHEEELSKATAGKISGKAAMKRRLNLHEEKIVNSTFFKSIINHFSDK